MASQANIRAVITADDRASKVLNNFGGQVESISKRAGQSITRWGKRATLAFGAAATFAIKSAAEFEQNRIAFDTMLGSAEAGSKMLKKLSDFAQATPFTLPDVVQGAKQLLAYNIEAEKVIPTFKALGNIAAGVGKDKLPQLVLAFGQVRAAGKLTGMELRQFTEAGVPLLDLLAKQSGKTAAEIKESMENGAAISFAEVEKAIFSASQKGGKFFNLLDKQSKTFGGTVSNLQDAIGRFARQVVGISDTGDIREGSIFARLKKGAFNLLEWLNANSDKITAKVQAMVDKFIAFGESVKRTFDAGGWKAVMDRFLNGMIEAFVTGLPKAISGLVVLVVQYADDIIMGFIKGIIDAAIKYPLDFLQLFLLLGFLPAKVLTALTKVLGNIPIVGPIFRWIIGAIGKVAQTILGPIRNFFFNTGRRIVNSVVSGLSNFFSRVWSTVWGAIRSVASRVASFVVGAFTRVGRGIITGIVAGIVAGAGAVYAAVKGVVNAALNQGNATERLKEGTFFKKRQMGGPVTSRKPYLVGERGPELFVPQSSGSIKPNNQLGMRGGGSIVNIHVNIGMYAGSEVEKRKVAKALLDAYKDLAASKNMTASQMLS